MTNPGFRYASSGLLANAVAIAIAIAIAEEKAAKLIDEIPELTLECTD